jgi:hypothetical protein
VADLQVPFASHLLLALIAPLHTLLWKAKNRFHLDCVGKSQLHSVQSSHLRWRGLTEYEEVVTQAKAVDLLDAIRSRRSALMFEAHREESRVKIPPANLQFKRLNDCLDFFLIKKKHTSPHQTQLLLASYLMQQWFWGNGS